MRCLSWHLAPCGSYLLLLPAAPPTSAAPPAAFAVSPFCLTLILCHVAGVPAVQNALKLSHLSCRFKLAVAADAATAAALAALHKLLCNPFNLLHTFRRKLK